MSHASFASLLIVSGDDNFGSLTFYGILSVRGRLYKQTRKKKKLLVFNFPTGNCSKSVAYVGGDWRSRGRSPLAQP